MARKVQVLLVDDLDGTELGEDGNTVKFGLDGTEYEIDLSTENMEQFQQEIAKYVEAARKVGRASASTARRSNRQASNAASSATNGGNGDSKAVRAWAVEKGLLKPDSRGRIPAHIVERFHAEAQGA